MYLPGELIAGGLKMGAYNRFGLINSNKVFTVKNGELTAQKSCILYL